VHRSRHTEVDNGAPIHHKNDVTVDTGRRWPVRARWAPVKALLQKTTKSAPAAERNSVVRVIVADSGPIQSQLLTRALRSRRDFRVSAVDLEPTALHGYMQANPADVVLIVGGRSSDMGLVRWLRVTHPQVAPVLLVDGDTREMVIDAFRAGAKGIFHFSRTPFRLLCKCITSVSRGEVWINSQQMHYVLDALSQVPALRVLNAKGKSLLTPREEQVVALVADGLSNREAAAELGLSEHTIKKYMLRIFDKLGISTRVELVLYAVSHGENRPAEWLPGNA
jgi:DNA-binding NarL/FixJ family response regulator